MIMSFLEINRSNCYLLLAQDLAFEVSITLLGTDSLVKNLSSSAMKSVADIKRRQGISRRRLIILFPFLSWPRFSFSSRP